MQPEELGIQERLFNLIHSTGNRASKESDLKSQSGLKDNQFKEALIRLMRKNRVRRWKNEDQENYIVASEFAFDAYYIQTVVRQNPLDLLFSPDGAVITVRRSIPFVLLSDPESDDHKYNRYRLMDSVA